MTLPLRHGKNQCTVAVEILCQL